MFIRMNLPPYPNFPNLNSNKISLRQILASDLKDLIEISFYDAIQAKTLAEATAMQAKIDQDYQDGNSIHWGIVDRLMGNIVGTCGYYRGFDNGQGELGCVLLPQYYGQGYMTAAMALAIDFGLNQLQLKRIWAATSQQNDKAIQLLVRLNFVKIADLADQEVEYELNIAEFSL